MFSQKIILNSNTITSLSGPSFSSVEIEVKDRFLFLLKQQLKVFLNNGLITGRATSNSIRASSPKSTGTRRHNEIKYRPTPPSGVE